MWSCYLMSMVTINRSKFDPNDMDRNIHAINTLSGILQGPFDVGNVLAGRQGVMEMMVALCGSEREVDQLVAVEALIHASTKTSKASFFISNGVTLLKDMYKKTKNEKIKIRALVVSRHFTHFSNCVCCSVIEKEQLLYFCILFVT